MNDRLKDRERARRDGTISTQPACYTFPPCSRHDNTEDDSDDRVRFTFFYAAGLLAARGVAIQTFSDRVLRLHDHKGTLAVVSGTPLPDNFKHAIREAWQHIAGEPQVEFVNPGEAWQTYWASKRFVSDWVAGVAA